MSNEQHSVETCTAPVKIGRAVCHDVPGQGHVSGDVYRTCGELAHQSSWVNGAHMWLCTAHVREILGCEPLRPLTDEERAKMLRDREGPRVGISLEEFREKYAHRFRDNEPDAEE